MHILLTLDNKEIINICPTYDDYGRILICYMHSQSKDTWIKIKCSGIPADPNYYIKELSVRLIKRFNTDKVIETKIISGELYNCPDCDKNWQEGMYNRDVPQGVKAYWIRQCWNCDMEENKRMQNWKPDDLE